MESFEHQRCADPSSNSIDEENIAICLIAEGAWKGQFADAVEQARAEAQELRAEQKIEQLLGHGAPIDPNSGSQRRRKVPTLPEGFRQEVQRRWVRGDIDDSVARYYLDALLRGDSLQVPGQDGRESLLGAVLMEDAQPLAEEYARGSEWRPICSVGRGAYGSVILWEKPRRNGPSLKIATKDTLTSSFFQDYCSEAHLTRRLNDLGCKNVINVVEWKFLKSNILLLPDGTSCWTKPKHRIAYEYAELRDLRYLTQWYKDHQLILPEAFIWHVFHSIANVLCYCRHGTNGPRTRGGWDSIVHGDIKLENIFMTQPDPDQHRLYPLVKLADFGLAYTLGGSVTAVQHYKSTYQYGTDGYMAPEIRDQSPENIGRRRAPYELHGPHSDVYSLGKSMQRCFVLLEEHKPVASAVHTMPRSSGKVSQGVEVPMAFYSTELINLLERCTEPDPRDRPKTYSLYRETNGRRRCTVTEPTQKRSSPDPAAVQNHTPTAECSLQWMSAGAM